MKKIIISNRIFNGELRIESGELRLKNINVFLKLLNEKYGVTESDFLSAELELVPSVKAFDIGFDRSMVGSYGQDDRVCAYTSLKAIFNIYPRKNAGVNKTLKPCNSLKVLNWPKITNIILLMVI